jgi:site-specific recombinase XerD
MSEVQSLLGHASIKTTAIYTEVAAQGLIDAVRASGANQLITTTLQEIDQ